MPDEQGEAWVFHSRKEIACRMHHMENLQIPPHMDSLILEDSGRLECRL